MTTANRGRIGITALDNSYQISKEDSPIKELSSIDALYFVVNKVVVRSRGCSSAMLAQKKRDVSVFVFGVFAVVYPRAIPV